MLRYLRRHWRGELPLAVAWWINGVGITVLSVLTPRQPWLATWIGNIDSREQFLVFLAGGLALLLLVPAWQIIGLFRAGDAHVARRSKFMAGRVAQSATTVLALLLAMRFLMFAAEAWSGARMAFPLGAPAQIVATHGGRVLEVNAAFSFGLAAEIEAALNRQPLVRRLRLTSGGGSLREAIRVRALIQARHLDTEAVSLCASACVSAYIAGRQRLLHRRARLGFHLPRNTGFGVRGPIAPFYVAELRYIRELGVPDWFIERWIVSGRDFWYPAPSQLREAGLVTAFVGPPKPGERVYFR